MEFMLQLLFTMAVLFVFARIGSIIVSRFGFPGLIGEIVIGLVIANLSFGDWSLLSMLDITVPEPGVESEGSATYTVIEVFAELGVIFLLFSVGLETKVKDLLGSGKAALLAAVLGVLLPFIAGLAIILAFDGNMNHALFMGAAMVATSVGITARIIKDMKLMETREARIIIAAAVIDDVLGMIVLAIVNGVAGSGEISIVDIISITLQAVVFVVAIILVCKYITPKLYDYFQKRHDNAVNAGKVPRSANKLVLSIIVCLSMAAFAEFIGLAGIIGAFLAGMLFAEHAWEWDLEHKIESITTFFISFFFINVGLQVDISTLTDTTVIILAVVIIVVALITKFIGCGFGAKFGDKGLDKQGMHIIGVGMMPRGEVGIIVASIGLSSGAMSSELYAVVVLMSVATTIIAPPILSKMFRKKYHEEYVILGEDRM
ncbi:MAG: cation:proton antiporter [Candidatus Methanomethylophilaceae archaeon]|jgi:Kef-type K+ transport system membrane component KefB|nr:cation:proton antiporter [Thermoplasmata archaeon]MBR3409622.1 cation:proton antiporter [Candidatus Methanomethylophilaceae archaeon]MBR3475547.1 cation:proton antiporter [Candidatus Methanomethylophilaceae archaeon]